MNRSLVLSVVLTAAAFASAFYVYYFRLDDLPARVVTHWNIHGEPDASVPRADALPYFLALPCVMVLMIILARVLPWLSPRQFGVDRFRGVFDYVMALVVTLFGYFHAVILWGSLDPNIALVQWFLAGLFLFFALIGNVLGQVRRNFWMGVRTPWTLASETVWDRTHRLTAWLWVAFGLAAFVAVLAGVNLLVCAGALLVVIVVPVVYSLVLYKRLEKGGQV
jgi:uncharacterized membrane protein